MITDHPFFKRRKINLDTTHRCALECPKCPRQFYYRDKGLTVPGEDLSLLEFNKIINFADFIGFEGQYSDPVHHRYFLDMLKLCYDKNISVEVHNASSVKSLDWYIKAFNANPNAHWIFAIDGLPKDSHIYRINQDGEKLFNIMKTAVKYLKIQPKWQYIIFSYNEKNIQEATKLANEIGVKFYTLISSRWQGKDDPLLPINPEYRILK